MSQFTWGDDDELFGLIRERLFTAAIGDVLDTMGLQRQFLPPKIQPLAPDMVVVGRAMPVLEADYFAYADADGQAELSRKPFGLMLHALDSLQRNEVYVATGGSPRYALWGELMSTRAQILGAAGAVVDGYSRDTRGILDLGFPTFSHGRYAQDQGYRGKVVDYRVRIEMDGVSISPGDIVMGDLDGVLIIPRRAGEEAIAKALEKVSKESAVRVAIVNGMPTVEAFEKFGVM
jgi:4-hydroxy-4-methyl-2-oxoglutarate aldolase